MKYNFKILFKLDLYSWGFHLRAFYKRFLNRTLIIQQNIWYWKNTNKIYLLDKLKRGSLSNKTLFLANNEIGLAIYFNADLKILIKKSNPKNRSIPERSFLLTDSLF